MNDDDLQRFKATAAQMGRSARFSLRRVLRRAGAPLEPGVVMFVSGTRFSRPAAPLDWLPGEEEWNRALDAARLERLEDDGWVTVHATGMRFD